MLRYSLLICLLFLLSVPVWAQNGYRSGRFLKHYKITPLYERVSDSPQDSLAEDSAVKSPEMAPTAAEKPPIATPSPVVTGTQANSASISQDSLAAVLVRLESLLTTYTPAPQATAITLPASPESPKSDSVSAALPIIRDSLASASVKREPLTQMVSANGKDTLVIQSVISMAEPNSNLQSQAELQRLLEGQAKLEAQLAALTALRADSSTPIPISTPAPTRIQIESTTDETGQNALLQMGLLQIRQDQQAMLDSMKQWQNRQDLLLKGMSSPSFAAPVRRMDSSATDSTVEMPDSSMTGFASDQITQLRLTGLQVEMAEMRELIQQMALSQQQAVVQAKPQIVLPTPAPATNDSSMLQSLKALQAQLDAMNQQQAREKDSLQAQLAAARLEAAQPKETPTTILLGLNRIRIYFAKGQSLIQPQDRIELDGIVDLLGENPDLSVAIRGFADKSGNPELNQRLSEQRAQSVKNYLLTKGVEAGRMQVESFGDARASLGGELDRRVEVVVEKMEEK